MKYYLSSFGLHNPFIEIDYADHLIYPIATEFENGFDLDYGMLLVGNKFVIDKDTYDFILDDNRGFLSPMSYSLKRLSEENLLEKIDLKSIIKSNESSLLQKTELLSSQFTYWITHIQNQWNVLKDNRSSFIEKYGCLNKKLINENHFTVTNAVKRINGKIDEISLLKFTKIILSSKKNYSKLEQEVIIETIKPLIWHLLVHDLAKHLSKSSILDWDDSAEYYDKLYTTRWDRNEIDDRLPTLSKRVFNLILPKLKPGAIDDIIRFINTKNAINSYRSELIGLIQSGTDIDERWLLEYQNKLITSNLKKEKVLTKVRFGSMLVGLFFPGGSIVSELVKEGASMAIEEGAVGMLHSKNFEWYYALQRTINK